MADNTRKFDFINHSMRNIHECVSDIYESLADDDYEQLRVSIKDLQMELRSLMDSAKKEEEREVS
jgi:hypothetical protein